MAKSLICHKCHSKLEPGMKFCVYCGTKVTENNEVLNSPIAKTVDLVHSSSTLHSDFNGIEVVKNKAQWKIQPGVIAQRISPSDFENLDNVTGINIQQGVSAYIYVDGHQVAQLKGGMYDFISHDEVETLLNKKATPGLIGHMKKAYHSLLKALTGKRVRDVLEENSQNYSHLNNYDDVVRQLQPKSNIEVYLKSDAPFDVIFGSETNADGESQFKPLQIMCKHLTADIAVSLQMQIADFNAFISVFLVHSNVATCRHLAEYMTPYVKAILMNQLRNTEINEYGIPVSVVANIEAMLHSNLSVPGIVITKVRDITSSNSDFVRLRQVADELYVSEKELEFAIRTNEFRNRLIGVENSRKIDEARTALELHKALSEINKDKALHEDEIDEFYMLLSRQKKIREATSDQEVNAALADIAKLDLMKEDEMDALTVELFTKKGDRSAVAEIMMMQSMANVEMKRIQIEEVLANEHHNLDNAKQRNAHDLRRNDVLNEIEIDDITRDHSAKNALKDVVTESEILNAKINQQKFVDQYSDGRFHVELDQAKTKAELELELEAKKRRMEADEMERLNQQNMDMFALWAEEDERKAQNDHNRKVEEKVLDQQHEHIMTQTISAHEQALKDKEIENRRVSAQMSAEQLMAEQAAKLDAEAQKHLADALGGTKVSEAEKRIREQQLEEARLREEQIRIEAQKREMLLREDQRNFFNQLSSDRDVMMTNMKEILGMVSGVKNKADEFAGENRDLQTRLSFTERNVDYREDELNRLDDRLRHEQERNDNTYSKVLQHEEKLQDTAIDAIKATSTSPKAETFIICPSCGKQVKKWKFCSECGSEIDINK